MSNAFIKMPWQEIRADLVRTFRPVTSLEELKLLTNNKAELNRASNGSQQLSFCFAGGFVLAYFF